MLSYTIHVLFLSFFPSSFQCISNQRAAADCYLISIYTNCLLSIFPYLLLPNRTNVHEMWQIVSECGFHKILSHLPTHTHIHTYVTVVDYDRNVRTAREKKTITYNINNCHTNSAILCCFPLFSVHFGTYLYAKSRNVIFICDITVAITFKNKCSSNTSSSMMLKSFSNCM